MGYIGSKPGDNIKQQKTLIENNQENTPIADEQDEEEQEVDNKSAEEIQFNMGGADAAQVDDQMLPDDDF
jgi:hypothetical protein